MKELSKPFYMWSIFGSMAIGFTFTIIAIAILIISGEDPHPAAIAVFIGMTCMIYPVMIYGAVMMYVLVYKIWVPLQDSYVRSSPGKAVGFLFIPFFNLYWMFQAYWGWTVDYNQYIRDKAIPNAPKANESMAMTFCILILCGFIPFLGILISLVGLVLMAIFFSQAIDGANAIIRHKLDEAWPPASPV